ncbi:MAG: transcriptional regulator [Proteobacteria bacterium]|nr:transcriptional regulator [Pseudomonadota bacterium]
MNPSTRKLLTIVTESTLERVLAADIERLGGHGYTITDARGKGSRGPRNASWSESSNIRIEVVCDDATAQAITAHLQARYYADYGMILFISEVEVLRPEKF